jgi:predicted nuclease of predicted toxin-antitoxin system
MKILIDMNLSPDWVRALSEAGLEAVHWSTVGDPRATDQTIFSWASENGYIVFTNDLDFGTILAATQAKAPSVIQIRGQDLLPASIEKQVIAALQKFAALLEEGALVTINFNRAKVRILPIERPDASRS